MRQRAADRRSGSRKFKFGSMQSIDLNRCPECGMTNSTAVEDERPEVCQMCGASLSSGVTCKVADFTPKRMPTEEEEDLTSVERSKKGIVGPKQQGLIAHKFKPGKEYNPKELSGEVSASCHGLKKHYDRKGAYEHKSGGD